MKGFAYWRDPLALAAVALYAANRWIFVPAGASGFWRSHFNDLLVIPAALPLLLWMHRRLSLRDHDRPPSAFEVGGHVLIWSLVCEYLGPRWSALGTADAWDVAAYALGGAAAWVWWRTRAHRSAIAAS